MSEAVCIERVKRWMYLHGYGHKSGVDDLEYLLDEIERQVKAWEARVGSVGLFTGREK
jgi:hypothetical protein